MNPQTQNGPANGNVDNPAANAGPVANSADQKPVNNNDVPLGPPPIGPDMIVPGTDVADNQMKNSDLPEVVIPESSSVPQYDPNYIPPQSTTANNVSQPVVNSPINPMPDVVATQTAPAAGPITNNGSNVVYGQGPNQDSHMLPKILIAIGAFLSLLLMMLLIWWLLLRDGSAPYVFDTSTGVIRDESGLNYEFQAPAGAERDDSSIFDAASAVDSYAFRYTDENGEIQFLGQAFVKENLDSDDSVSIYADSDQQQTLADNLKDTYSLADTQFATPVEYTSENIEQGATSDFTATNSSGADYYGRVLVKLTDNRLAYNYLLVAPIDVWNANTTKIDDMFAQFKIDSGSSSPLVVNDGSKEERDVSIEASTVSVFEGSSVEVGETIEQKIVLKNNSNKSLEEKSAEIVFELQGSEAEIVAILDSDSAFECNATSGHTISADQTLSCRLKKKIDASASPTINLRYKHTEAASSVTPDVELKVPNTAQWSDSDETKDEIDLKEYQVIAQAGTPVSEDTTEETTTGGGNQPVVENKPDSPDTAGAADISVVAPVLLILTVVIYLGTSQIKGNKKFF